MVRLINSHTETLVDLTRSSGTFTRLHVYCPRRDLGDHASELRLLLVTDLLRRTLEELHSQQVLITLVNDETAMARTSHLMNVFWIPEPDGLRPPSHEGPEAPDIVLECYQPHMPYDEINHSWEVPRVTVGPVLGYDDLGTIATEEDVLKRSDPLTVRLALLAWPYHDAISLSPARLQEADTILTTWRTEVAAWARYPSSPIPREIADRVRAALDNQLNIGAVIDTMRDISHQEMIPAGAKFETFISIDRILACNLTRELS